MGHLLGYARVSTTNLLSFFVGFGALLFTAQYLQLVLGLSPLEAGLWSLPSSAGFILGSMATPLLVTGSVIFSLALAPVDTLATDLAVEAAPPERAGAASAITETSAEFGGALGIAVLGVVGTAVHRAQMAEAVPAGVPDQAAAAARDTLGGGGGGGRPTPRAGRRGLLEVARRRSPRACTWPLWSAPRPRWPSPSWSSSCSEAYAQAPNPMSNRTLRQDPAGPGKVGSSMRPGRRPVPDSDTTCDEEHAVTMSRGADPMGENDPGHGQDDRAAAG